MRIATASPASTALSTQIITRRPCYINATIPAYYKCCGPMQEWNDTMSAEKYPMGGPRKHKTEK